MSVVCRSSQMIEATMKASIFNDNIDICCYDGRVGSGIVRVFGIYMGN